MDGEHEESVNSIRDTPLAVCIGARILEITADDFEEVPKGERSKIYLHLDNGETMFCTIGHEGEELLGMLDMKAED